MTGDELKQLRHDLGDAIGRRLSTTDMAQLCGLSGKNAQDTYRKWEEGDGPSGPVAALLSILAYASDAYPVPRDFTEQVHHVRLPGGSVSIIGREISTPIIRHQMRAEILRRLS